MVCLQLTTVFQADNKKYQSSTPKLNIVASFVGRIQWRRIDSPRGPFDAESCFMYDVIIHRHLNMDGGYIAYW